MKLNFFEIFTEALPNLFEGALTTLQVTALSVLIGVAIGLFVGLARISQSKFMRFLAMGYIDFIRGTPLLVQILIIYFGIPQLIRSFTGEPFPIPAFIAGVAACGINSGAYVAEIVRAGIQSIDRGQMEAARSLGMTNNQAMKYIILPQAFKRMIPPLGNEFIAMLKDTSLLSVIGITELTRQGQLYIAVTAAPFPIYTGVLIMYLVMTLSISRLVGLMERRLAKSDRSA